MLYVLSLNICWLIAISIGFSPYLIFFDLPESVHIDALVLGILLFPIVGALSTVYLTVLIWLLFLKYIVRLRELK